MKQKTYVATITCGLSNRAALAFANLVKASKSEVWIEQDRRKRDGKSVADLLGLSTRSGGTFTVTVEGEDEERVIELIAELMESDLGLA
jgi:phosphotransferase system HPr (HPr) family protein